MKKSVLSKPEVMGSLLVGCVVGVAFMVVVCIAMNQKEAHQSESDHYAECTKIGDVKYSTKDHELTTYSNAWNGERKTYQMIIYENYDLRCQREVRAYVGGPTGFVGN